MANQNICEVELLTNMTANTNAIVEENGSCRRVNLKKEFDKLNEVLYEDGIINNWYYRKYNNGFAECFISFESDELRCGDIVRELSTKAYLSNSAILYYPFEFVKIYSVNPNVHGLDTTWHMSQIYVNSIGTNSLKYLIYSLNPDGETMSPRTYQFRIFGQWK